MVHLRLTLMWAMLAVAGGLPAQAIVWRTGEFAEAKAQAQQEGKWLMVFVCADWLEVCTLMDDSSFAKPAVVKALEPLFVLWRHTPDSVSATGYLDGLQLRHLPEFIFIDSEGVAQYRDHGYKTAEEMLQMIEAARDPSNHLSRRAQVYAQGNRDPKFVRDYILDAAANGEDMLAPSLEYLQGLPMDQLMSTDNWRIAAIAVQDIRDPHFRYVLLNKQAFEQQYGKGAVDDFVVGVYRNSLLQACQQQDARLLSECQAVVRQLLPASESEAVVLQDRMTYHAYGKDWVSYEKVAIAFMQQYEGNDPGLLNDVAWQFCQHAKQPGSRLAAIQWAQRSVELQPAYWNYHTLASLLHQAGQGEAALRAAERAKGLAADDREAAQEVEKLLQEIRNSR